MRGFLVAGIFFFICAELINEFSIDIVFSYMKYISICVLIGFGIVILVKDAKKDNEYVKKQKKKEYKEITDEWTRQRLEEEEKERAFWGQFTIPDKINFEIEGIKTIKTIDGHFMPVEISEEIYVQLSTEQKNYYQRGMKRSRKIVNDDTDYIIYIYFVKSEMIVQEKKERGKVEYGQTIEL